MISCVPHELQRWLDDYLATASRPDQIQRWVERIDGAILSQIPELARDATLVDELHASTRGHWQNYLRTLPGPAGELVLAR
jgi:hypothetical protein